MSPPKVSDALASEGEASFRRWLRRVLDGKDGPGLRWDKRLVFWAVLGAVMGTSLDWFHVFTNTAYYVSVPKIPGLGVAWFVPLEFMLAGVVVGMVRPWVDDRFGGPKGAVPLWKAVAGLFTLAVAWGATGLLTVVCWSSGKPVCASNPNVPFLVLLLAGGALAWYVFDRTILGIFVGLLTAAIGVGLELYVVHVRGVYRYTYADFYGVPCWLPALYLVASGSLGNFGRFLKQRTGPPGLVLGPDARPNEEVAPVQDPSLSA